MGRSSRPLGRRIRNTITRLLSNPPASFLDEDDYTQEVGLYHHVCALEGRPVTEAGEIAAVSAAKRYATRRHSGS